MIERRPQLLCAALAVVAVMMVLTPSLAKAATSTLGPGQTLTAGQWLTSADGHYSLIMQSDGNLVLYVAGGRVLWSSKTKGDTGDHLLMQTNGNLVLYDAAGNALWSSNTSGGGCSHLVVQDDGNTVLYGPSRADWATGTVNSTLQPGEKLAAGQGLFSAGGEKFHLIMQADGNLVLYNSAAKWLWATKTEGTGAQYVVMQGDGNLVLYTGAGKAVWSSATNGKSGAHLVVQSDGNVVLYLGSTAVFSTGTAGAAPGFRKAPAIAVIAVTPPNCGVPLPTPAPAPTPPPPVVVYVPVVVPVPTPRAPNHVKVRLVMSWTWNGPRTRLFRVSAERLPRHAGIVVTCRGRGCPAHHAHLASARVKHLLRSLAGQTYRAGDRVLITIHAPREVSERIELVIRSGRKPEAKLL